MSDHSYDEADDENFRFADPSSILKTIQSSDSTAEEKLAAARKLSDVVVHLKDGKDYIDDILEPLNATYAMEGVSTLAKSHVALATVRILAHGWQWEPEVYGPLLDFVASLINATTATPTDEEVAVALQAVDEIFEAENDSGTDQDGKDDKEILKLLATHLVPCPQQPGGKKGNIVAHLQTFLEAKVSSTTSSLIEAASSLLSRLPQKKRPRGEGAAAGGAKGSAVEPVPKGFSALVARLVALTSESEPSADAGSQAQQLGAVLKGIDKVMLQAGFEAINELADDELEDLPKVEAHITVIENAIVKVFQVPGKKNKPFDDPSFENEERCGNPHWDRATSVFAMILAIRSSPWWEDIVKKQGGATTAINARPTAETLSSFRRAWRSHRYHIGEEFEMAEAGVAYVAKQNEVIWKEVAAAVPLAMEWTCVLDPFKPQPEQVGWAGHGKGLGA